MLFRSAMDALDSGAELAEHGVIRIGMSVGRKGDTGYKNRMSDHYHHVVNTFRQSTGLGQFNSIKVKGVRNGNAQTLDLLEDQLVNIVEVDPDKWFDPDKSAKQARKVLIKNIREGRYSNLQLPPGGTPIRTFNQARI